MVVLKSDINSVVLVGERVNKRESGEESSCGTCGNISALLLTLQCAIHALRYSTSTYTNMYHRVF